MSVVHTVSAVKNRRKTEAAPSQAADGTWSMRLRQAGHDIWVTSQPSAKAAKAAAYAELAARTGRSKPHGKGPSQSLAAALGEYAMQMFKFKKGAPQEIRRLNVYLRAAGMHTLVATPPKEAAKGVRFDIGLEAWTDERKIPPGLKTFRRALETKSADSNRMRAVLATKPVEKIARQDLQVLVGKLREEGCSAATVYQEIAILKRFFNFVQTTWAWPLFENPATGLELEVLDNERSRVLTKQEQQFFDEALIECKNKQAALAVKLLLHTAMRASEPLTDLRWGDIDWTKSTLRLRDSKTRARNVPLSNEALRRIRVPTT